MRNRVFSPDNLFFRITGTLFDMTALSAVTVLISLPVVTAYPALSALYYVAVKCFRGGDRFVYSGYFRAFRENLFTGAAASAACAFGCAPVIWLYLYLEKLALQQAGGAVVLYVAFYVLLALPAGFLCWIYPLLGRFEHSFGSLMAAAAEMTARHAPTSVVIGLLNAEAVIACLQHPMALAIVPAAAVLLTSLFTERVFKKYLPPGPEETDVDGQNGDT